MLLKILKVHGHSMQPAIKNGQKVLISSVPYFFTEPKINDIVAFRIDNKIFIKRIVSIKDEKYFLRGDNIVDSFDSRKFGRIKKKDIQGKCFI